MSPSDDVIRDQAPAIGVFDSGVGGLTVLAELHRLLPDERTVYLGDTARVPYGTRSADAVVRYAHNNTRTLLECSPLKAVVIACNTASAVALEPLQQALPVPVFGVIEPGAQAAIDATQGGRITVLGTKGTVRSGAYPRALRALGHDGDVSQLACPLLVPLVEESWLQGDIPDRVVRTYLRALDDDTDTLVLGCTHYPLLRDVIRQQASEVLGRDVAVVDGGMAVARQVQQVLEVQRESATSLSAPHRYLATDAPDQVAQLSRTFLGQQLDDDDVELVNVIMHELPPS